MKTRLPGFVAGTLTFVGAGFLSPASAQEIDMAEFAEIREPRLTTRAAETVLEVRATGSPDAVGGQAFGLLFQLYFTAPETPKAVPPTPRARWPSPPGTPPDEWIGQYALPVPAGTSLPGHQAPAGLEARVTTWEYGEVVEMLHVGPYDREEPALAALREFAASQGYQVLDGHEEEYVRGPTMTGPGNPDEYLTILRYRVRPRSGS